MVYLDRIAGKTIIKFTECDPALLTVDAVVEEQDTHLLLGKAPVISNVVTGFPQLVKKMQHQVPEIPGTVIVKKTKPIRFIAIIYDIDNSNICHQEWLETALKNIFIQCWKYKIAALAMPLLGTSYGRIDGPLMIKILEQSLFIKRREYPRRIFIYRI
jgi:hypothetical protein